MAKTTSPLSVYKDYNKYDDATKNQLNQFYGQRQQADQTYKQTTQQIGNQEDLAEQEAYITSQKVLKYLRMAGMAGNQSINSGDVIQAQANYRNELGNINSLYGQQKQSAQQGYQSLLSGIGAQENSLINQFYQRQQTEQDMDDSQMKAVYDQNVEQGLLDMYSQFETDDEGNISQDDYNDLREFYERYADQMSDVKRAEIEFLFKEAWKTSEGSDVSKADTSKKADGEVEPDGNLDTFLEDNNITSINQLRTYLMRGIITQKQYNELVKKLQ